jgi:hypothetical protein
MTGSDRTVSTRNRASSRVREAIAASGKAPPTSCALLTKRAPVVVSWFDMLVVTVVLSSCGGRTSSNVDTTVGGGGASGSSSSTGGAAGAAAGAGGSTGGGATGGTGIAGSTSAGGATAGAGGHHCKFAPTGGPKTYPPLWFQVGCVVSPSPCPGSQVCCASGCLHICDGIMDQENKMVCQSDTSCSDAIECPVEAVLPWLGPGGHPLRSRHRDGRAARARAGKWHLKPAARPRSPLKAGCAPASTPPSACSARSRSTLRAASAR